MKEGCCRVQAVEALLSDNFWTGDVARDEHVKGTEVFDCIHEQGVADHDREEKVAAISKPVRPVGFSRAILSGVP